MTKLFDPHADEFSRIATPVAEARHKGQLFYRPSPDMREGVAAMASMIQAHIGPIPNTSIVITDNINGMQSKLFLDLALGRDLAKTTTGEPVINLPLRTDYFDDTEALVFIKADQPHSVVCLSRKHAQAISDPHSDAHIAGVATLAHELGHVRAIRAGFDLPMHRQNSPEDQAAHASISEYLAVRTEISVIDKFYGEGFEKSRPSAFSHTTGRRVERLSSKGYRLKSLLPGANDELLSRIGYGIGTLNGYLDGFRAVQSDERLPVRPDHLQRMTPRTAKMLNATRGGLAALYRSLENGGTPEPLIERAMIEHRRAIEVASTPTTAHRKARSTDKGIERD